MALIQTELKASEQQSVSQPSPHKPLFFGRRQKAVTAFGLIGLTSGILIYQASGLPLGMLFVYALIAAPILAKIFLSTID